MSTTSKNISMRLRKNISLRLSWSTVALSLSVLSVLCCAWPANAKPPAPSASASSTPAQYQARLHEAVKRLDELAAQRRHAAGDGQTEAADEAGRGARGREVKILNEVRRLLPPQEKVERGDGGGSGGAAVNVDNGWLHEALRGYEEKSNNGADDGDCARMLSDIIARLRALDERLGESAGGEIDARARDKDAEKGRLSAILRSPEYNRKASEGGALGRAVEGFVELIRSLIPDIKPIQPGASPTVSRGAQIFILALGLGVIAYVARRYWLRRGTTLRGISLREARVVLGEQLAPDETSSDLLAESERMARAGDLRGAIRKAYVALLCELGDRKVIRLARHKTNRDYLRAVRRSASPQLFQEMQPLTLNFERHWYGSEDATEIDWQDFRARCRHALDVR